MGLAHLVQGIIMVLLALFVITDLQDFMPDIVAYHMGLNENFELITVSKVLFQLPFALVATGFVFLSAFFHFLIVLFKKTYLKQIEKGYNPPNLIKDDDKNGYDFSQYVSFEEFKRLENLTEIEKEMFDIYKLNSLQP
jgi:hypothetical protein